MKPLEFSRNTCLLHDIQEYPNLCYRINDKTGELELANLFSCNDYKFSLFHLAASSLYFIYFLMQLKDSGTCSKQLKYWKIYSKVWYVAYDTVKKLTNTFLYSKLLFWYNYFPQFESTYYIWSNIKMYFTRIRLIFLWYEWYLWNDIEYYILWNLSTLSKSKLDFFLET